MKTIELHSDFLQKQTESSLSGWGFDLQYGWRRLSAMIQNLERIEYRKGMLEKGMKADGLPVKVWRGARTPEDVRKAINEENLLNLGGVYGDKNAGDPVEYDNLKLLLTDDTVEITAFNRGITLLMSDDERELAFVCFSLLLYFGQCRDPKIRKAYILGYAA
jgi:hypothetical protein